MTTAEKYMDYAPSAAQGAPRPSSRLGSWFRTRLEAYVASNEAALGLATRTQSMDVVAS